MKKLLIIILCLLPSVLFAQTVNCKVTKVSDGDTIHCLTAEKQLLKVRLSQIDAPESKQDYGLASKKTLIYYIANKDVSLNVASTDRYGRYLAEIFLDGENINKKMVKNGMAWAYTRYATDAEYSQLEQNARNNKRGLWKDPNPIEPEKWRIQQKQAREKAKNKKQQPNKTQKQKKHKTKKQTKKNKNQKSN